MTQQQRTDILFEEYPMLEKAYNHCLEFRNIYEVQDKIEAEIKLHNWKQANRKLSIKKFNIAANSISYNQDNILNFFNNRNTNANAESFNSKIKLFRANLRGVSNTTFFLFRLAKLFA